MQANDFIAVPAAYASFPKDIVPNPPRSWLARCANVQRWSLMRARRAFHEFPGCRIATRAWFGNAQAIVRRARAGATLIAKRIFSAAIGRARCCGATASTGLRDDEGVPLICPTCQIVFTEAFMLAAACYFAWGCFRYFSWERAVRRVWGCFPDDGRRMACLAVARGLSSRPSPRSFQSVFAFASLKLRRTPRFALQAPRGRATRSPQGEAWWARQDSNLQPDRYERPALTIELQAPPRTAAARRHATVPAPFTGTGAIRQCRG